MSPEGQYGKCVSAVPSALLERFSDILPQSGLALDVACGCGQNAVFLARHGLTVVGIDRSRKALAVGKEVATRSNLNVNYVQADLTLFTLLASTFSVIMCFKYRDPELYPTLRAALLPGGLLVYETYTCEHPQYGLRPRNPAHLLEWNELLRTFCDWEVIFYREEWIGRGMASLVARKPFSPGGC